MSRQVREIFLRHTDLVEPLSLDEAYLDVTENKLGLASATAVALAIRQAIREETGLTASAGIAPNKFLAKIASDWRKPDGQFVIRPAAGRGLPHAAAGGQAAWRGPGDGRQARRRSASSPSDNFARMGEVELERRFGRWGRRLHELSRGIDEHPVVSERPTLQISAEDTFESDLRLLRNRGNPAPAGRQGLGGARRRSPSASAAPWCSSSRPATSASSRAA